MAKVIGPGGTTKAAKSTGGKSVGPGGVSGSNTSYTTSRGYESGRTSGLRTNYRENGSANNNKAGRG